MLTEKHVMRGRAIRYDAVGQWGRNKHTEYFTSRTKNTVSGWLKNKEEVVGTTSNFI